MKTWLGIIQAIGPRLTNPKAKANEFIMLFRYADDKEKVIDVLRTRAEIMQNSLYKAHDLKIVKKKSKPRAGTGASTTATVAKPLNIKGIVAKPRTPTVPPPPPPLDGNGIKSPKTMNKLGSHPKMVMRKLPGQQKQEEIIEEETIKWRASFGPKNPKRVQEVKKAISTAPPPPPAMITGQFDKGKLYSNFKSSTGSMVSSNASSSYFTVKLGAK